MSVHASIPCLTGKQRPRCEDIRRGWHFDAKGNFQDIHGCLDAPDFVPTGAHRISIELTAGRKERLVLLTCSNLRPGVK